MTVDDSGSSRYDVLKKIMSLLSVNQSSTWDYPLPLVDVHMPSKWNT